MVVVVMYDHSGNYGIDDDGNYFDGICDYYFG